MSDSSETENLGTALTAKIDSISTTGEVSIKFSNKLIQNETSLIEALNFTVTAGLNSDPTNLNFTNKTLSYDEERLSVQLDFDSAKHVS